MAQCRESSQNVRGYAGSQAQKVLLIIFSVYRSQAYLFFIRRLMVAMSLEAGDEAIAELESSKIAVEQLRIKVATHRILNAPNNCLLTLVQQKLHWNSAMNRCIQKANARYLSALVFGTL